MAETDVKDAAEILEDTMDVVEDTLDLMEAKVSWMSSNPKVLVGIVSLAALAAGSALGYLIASKRLSAKYQAIADEQIADVKERYSIPKIMPDEVKPDLEVLVAKAEAEDIIDKQGYKSYNRVPEVIDEKVEEAVEEVKEALVVSEVSRNIFESDNPDTYFNLDEELAKREERPDEPFVLTADEFEAGEADYEQSQLTYYDGDDVLCDDKDQPIDDKEATIGFENLLRFGHGSNDPNVVYIRNTRLELDFEVTHSDGKYAKEVLGFDDELSHSDTHRRRKRQLRDD